MDTTAIMPLFKLALAAWCIYYLVRVTIQGNRR
jgi:hypothetical protein